MMFFVADLKPANSRTERSCLRISQVEIENYDAITFEIPLRSAPESLAPFGVRALKQIDTFDF